MHHSILFFHSQGSCRFAFWLLCHHQQRQHVCYQDHCQHVCYQNHRQPSHPLHRRHVCVAEGLSCMHSFLALPLAVFVSLWTSATWRSSGSLKEAGRHGGHDLDGGRVDVVAAAKGLFRALVRCCVCLWVTTAIAIVRPHSGCSWCCCGLLVALRGKDFMVTKMLKENVMMSWLLIKYCWGAKQTNKQTSKHTLDCNCNWSNRRTCKIDR